MTTLFFFQKLITRDCTFVQLILCSTYVNHPQNKFSAPASIQLQPRRSLVSQDAPLQNLLEDGEGDSAPVNISINNSILADGEVKKVKEQLPAQHPARKLSIAADDIRKKLSSAQLDDLLVMIGAQNFIK